MNKSHLIITLCAGVFSLLTMPSHATLVSTFTFQSETIDCFSEISTACSDISVNKLSGSFLVDLSVLDASGNGSISWKNFLRFDATNSVSSWNRLNLRDGGILLNNWMVADFGIDARPDYSEGWNWPTDGGGERLLIRGFGVATSTPAFSNASSEPGAYCPGTGEWNPKTESCSGGTVNVNTLGIQAEYTSPVISAVPVPATAWLVGLGLGLIGLARHKKA